MRVSGRTKPRGVMKVTRVRLSPRVAAGLRADPSPVALASLPRLGKPGELFSPAAAAGLGGRRGAMVSVKKSLLLQGGAGPGLARTPRDCHFAVRL